MRFVKPGLVAIVVLAAGCHSSPRRSAPPAAAPAAPMPAAPMPAAKNAAPNAKAPAAAARAPVPNIPIPERAAQQYAEALRLMQSGKISDAELEFQQLAEAYPAFSGPEINLGLLYLRESQYALAEGAFKAALIRNPDSVIANDELGIAERQLGKFAEAEAAYQRTIALEPSYAAAYLNLGVLYDLYLSEPQKALEQYERYLELTGDNKQVAGWIIELKKRVGAPPAPAKKEPA